MACSIDLESLDEEVKELLWNYKHKKPSLYEPSTLKNFKECMIGLSEEFGVLNINYVFNPHVDLDGGNLRPDAIVKLVNATWTLLHYHKNAIEKVERLMEQNHVFEQNHKQSSTAVQRLKKQLELEKNEAKACVASAQRIADRSDELLHKVMETRARLLQVTKQKEANERSMRHEINRLKLDNNKLLDRLGRSTGHTPCSEICDSTILQLKEREKQQRVVIAKLQANNQELLREVLSMKEEILLTGLQDLDLTKGNK